jgi:hypothetical protein
MKFLYVLFLTMFLFSCSEEAQPRGKASTSSSKNEPVRDTVAPSDGDVVKEEVVEEPAEEEYDGEEKTFHNLELSDGACTFKFENKEKSEACALLLDESYSDCIINDRKDVHKISCEGDKSFEDALKELYGI